MKKKTYTAKPGGIIISRFTSSLDKGDKYMLLEGTKPSEESGRESEVVLHSENSAHALLLGVCAMQGTISLGRRRVGSDIMKIVHSKKSVLGIWYSVLGIRYSVLGIRYSVCIYP